MSRINSRRPIGVTILAILIFLSACWNGLRLGAAIHFWTTLSEYGAHPLYEAISGGIWLAYGVLPTWGLWRGKAWARIATLGGAAGYGAWYWIDRLFLEQPHANWPFAIEVTAVILIFILFILFAPATRRFFRTDTHGRKQEN